MNKMRVLRCLSLILALSFVLVGCSSKIKPIGGFAEGKIGDKFKTEFFEFDIAEAKFYTKNDNPEIKDDKKIVDVTINIKNTFGEDLPMFNNDFQIQWHNLGAKDEDFAFGILLPENKDVMPEEYTLQKNKTVKYHIVYEVPLEAKEFSISYQEYFEKMEKGDVFFVYFNDEK